MKFEVIKYISPYAHGSIPKYNDITLVIICTNILIKQKKKTKT